MFLTPLQGTVEQIRFNYGYQAKINSDSKYYEKHRCIETDPLSAPRIGYWEVSYSDRDKFAGKNVSTFLRDYNLYIEVTNIRKDGVNISKDDFNIPKSVSDYFDYGEDVDFMRDYYKDDVIKELINTDYVGKWEYSSKKADEVREKKDKLCFDFLKEL
ncbi:hypothetical protein [Proteiniphilum sp. X52]|uniref:hypothetical protein n=1 Tax=Proteiniphilum sp. X52 TaxID=2382159 RepID=UPI000F0A3ACD|nr:hypothetical protein [Proteiniphilum sp. X52]RNC65130.1 hypothetical protein D7D25_08120 [Proteiniphilum sp. X52]